eukprot:TRINITY_DN11549_c0_g1_i4.p4 TRINITY_DN11549_c0_g1~~TRINITY_DN11549_c0_g1_i4.p4  ORF type:complete len:206 (-),score=68.40 TRINITY_DN11549_c0_g1_i4:11-628(-)
MNLDKLQTYSFADARSQYTHRDTMLYALGVSACLDPLNEADLKFVYEAQLQALPSMSCVLAHPGFWIKAPELEVNWVKLVHAEQFFDLQRPLPAKGEVVGSYKITGVVDKGAQTGALMYFEKALHTIEGELIGTVGSTYFLRGDGGCGNWGESGKELTAVPATAPDGTLDMPTLPIAALIYRLSGEIGRAVQQECRDRSRMPSSA